MSNNFIFNKFRLIHFNSNKFSFNSLDKFILDLIRWISLIYNLILRKKKFILMVEFIFLNPNHPLYYERVLKELTKSTPNILLLLSTLEQIFNNGELLTNKITKVWFMYLDSVKILITLGMTCPLDYWDC